MRYSPSFLCKRMIPTPGSDVQVRCGPVLSTHARRTQADMRFVLLVQYLQACQCTQSMTVSVRTACLSSLSAHSMPKQVVQGRSGCSFRRPAPGCLAASWCLTIESA